MTYKQKLNTSIWSLNILDPKLMLYNRQLTLTPLKGKDQYWKRPPLKK